MNTLAPTSDQIERLEAGLLQFPQVDCPVEHHFAPHVYTREVFMPAGTFVIGHQHKTEHLNIVLTGKARVMMNGEIHDIAAPCIFKSSPGVRKILYIVEDCRWATVHPTDETNLEKLAAELISPSDAFTQHQQMKELERFKAQIGGTR